MPGLDEFEYSFDNLAQVVERFLDKLEIDRYSIYLMDLRGSRRLSRGGESAGTGGIIDHPEWQTPMKRVLQEFWNPIKMYWKEKTEQNAQILRDSLLTIEATKWQYTHGVRNVETIAPDNWFNDQFLLDRPGNKDIQIELFYSYGTNPPLYPEWQAYFRRYQPPTLIAWGKNDYIFPGEGAEPYKRDLQNVDFHLLDTGHFALEEDGEVIANLMRDFLDRNLVGTEREAAAIG